MTAEQECFYERTILENWAALYRFALKKLGHQEDAEDVLFDTFCEALIQIDTLFSHEKPAAWLQAVLRNKIGNYITAQRKRTEHIVPKEDDSILRAVRSSDIPPGGEFHQIILSIPQILTPEEYQFFRLSCIEGMQHTQLAEHYGITVASSRKRLQRIRNRLKAAFFKSLG